MNKQIIGLAAFLLVVFVLVPVTIAASGRWDLYYTLTSVALLSSRSASLPSARHL